MIPDERRTQILTALHAKGYASVEELAKTVYVSIPTIRRDLIIMEKDGQIRRTHGGALYVSPDSGIPPLALRNQVHIEEKTKIGKMAASMIKEGHSIFIDSSSTGFYLVKSIPRDRQITVMTNGLAIAQAFDEHTHVHVEMTGGTYDSHHACMVGWEAASFINQRYADWFFVSGNTMDARHGITAYSSIDIPIKQAMAKNARKTVLLMDHSKMDQVSYYQIFEWKDIDILVTDREVSSFLQKTCYENHVQIKTNES